MEAGQTVKCGKPEKTFQGKYVYDWSISHDGDRFLVMKEVGPDASAVGGPRKINIVMNWTEERKQRVPVKYKESGLTRYINIHDAAAAIFLLGRLDPYKNADVR